MGDLIKLNGNKALTVNKLSVTRAEILIYSDIGSFWDDQVSAKMVKEALDDLDGVNEIVVRINSPGGDVFEGFTIYNLLKQHSAKITVMIDGMAASIASIIMLAGDEIIAGEGAIVMIHDPWTCACGNSKDLERTIERLDLVTDQLVNIYHRATGLDKIEIRRLMALETYFDAEQALEKGFIDRKMEDEENLNIAASAVFSNSVKRAEWINKMPKIKTANEEAKEQLENFKKEAQGFLARK